MDVLRPLDWYQLLFMSSEAWTIGLKLAVRVMLTAVIVVVIATTTATAARFTAAAPLTLHWKYTIVALISGSGDGAWPRANREMRLVSKARSLWFGPFQAAPSAAIEPLTEGAASGASTPASLKNRRTKPLRHRFRLRT